MPHGKPRKPTNLRLDPDLTAEVRRRTDNLTAAIEEGLRLWIKRDDGKRRAEREAAPERPDPADG